MNLYYLNSYQKNITQYYLQVNYSTFVILGVLVFGFHWYLFDGGVTPEMNLYTILTTYLFDAFAYSFCVWYYNLIYCVFDGPSIAVLAGTWPVILCCVAVIIHGLCSCILTVVVVVVTWICRRAVILWLLFRTLFWTLLIAQLG